MSSFESKIENGGSLVVWRFPCRIWHLRKQPIELQNSENSYGLILVLLRFWAIEYYLATIIFDGFFSATSTGCSGEARLNGQK